MMLKGFGSVLIRSSRRISGVSIGEFGITAPIATQLVGFHHQRRMKSSASEGAKRKATINQRDDIEGGFFPVYVHHVSKIALKHLQDHRAEWLVGLGLDSRLHINPNGTFVLTFPTEKGQDAGKIWTSYDSARKQHWLSVYRQRLAVRFLLKDHKQTMESKLHDSKRTENQIYGAVDQMILAVNQTDTMVRPASQRI